MQKVLALLLVLFLSLGLEAETYYWLGTTSTDWSTAANWSLSSGGSPAASIPGASDTTIFDANSSDNAVLATNTSSNGVILTAGFSDTVKMGSYNLFMYAAADTFYIGGGVFMHGSGELRAWGGLLMAGGSFIGGSGSADIEVGFHQTGGSFNCPSGALSIHAAFDNQGGIFHHNNSTVTLLRGADFTRSEQFYNLEFSPTTYDPFTIPDTSIVTVLNLLKYNYPNHLLVNGGILRLLGDMIIENKSTISGGDAILEISGTTDQTIDGNEFHQGGNLPNVLINKTVGKLILKDTISVKGDWVYSQGDIDDTTHHNLVCFSYRNLIQGSHHLQNVLFDNLTSGSYTIDDTSVLAIDSMMTLGYGNAINMNGGQIDVNGHLRILSEVSSSGVGNLLIRISGSEDQTIFGNTVANGGYIGILVFDKTDGILSIQDSLSIRQKLEIVEADVNASSPHFIFLRDSLIIRDSVVLSSIVSRGGAEIEIDSGKALTLVNNYESMLGSPLSIAVEGDIYVQGDIKMRAQSTARNIGFGTITLQGANDQTISGSGAFQTGRLQDLYIDKSGGILAITDTISIYGDIQLISGDVQMDSVALLSWYAYGSGDTFQMKGISGDDTMHITNLFCGDNDYRKLNGGLLVEENLYLYTGRLLMDSNIIILENADTSALQSTTGYLISEANDLGSAVYWRTTSAGSGTYIIPFRNAAANVEIPVSYRLNSSGTPYQKTYMVTATYGTDATNNPNNLPYPPGIDFLKDSIGTDLSLYLIDRYWRLETKGYLTEPGIYAELKYANADMGGANLLDEDSLVVQAYNGTSWGPKIGSVSAASDILIIDSLIKGYPVLVPIDNGHTIFNPPLDLEYASLKFKLDGTYYETTNGNLYFRYNEKYYVDGPEPLSYTIYDWERNAITTGIGLNRSYGMNWLKLDLCNSSTALDEESFYILEVEETKGDKYYLRFRYMGNCIDNYSGSLGN